MWWDLHCSHQEHNWQSGLLHWYGYGSMGVRGTAQSYSFPLLGTKTKCVCVCVFVCMHLPMFEPVWHRMPKSRASALFTSSRTRGQTLTSQFKMSHWLALNASAAFLCVLCQFSKRFSYCTIQIWILSWTTLCIKGFKSNLSIQLCCCP